MDLIHNFLSQEAYWSKGIPKETVKKSIENTPLCFGVYKGEIGTEVIEQVGFARVIYRFSDICLSLRSIYITRISEIRTIKMVNGYYHKPF